MGKHARNARRATVRRLRECRLASSDRDVLGERARYEGSPYHKRSPGDFGLTPPAAPRADATLCDEAGIRKQADAVALFARAIEGGLVSTAVASTCFPKHIWVVDEDGRVFEATYGGSRVGVYHGYPIRNSDPLSREIVAAWRKHRCAN